MLSLVYSRQRQRQPRTQPLGLQLGRAGPHFTTVGEPLSGGAAGQRLGADVVDVQAAVEARRRRYGTPRLEAAMELAPLEGLTHRASGGKS